MRKYTLYDDIRIDQKIENDMRKIVNTIIAKFGKDKIEAIILTGGFGRGEGSVLLKNGNPIPFNDYDVAVVPKETKLNKKCMASISQQLARDLSIDEVSLWIIKKLHLKKRPLSISSYEMKMAHQVLYGNLDILTMMPHYESRKLPLIQATILLYNRGIDLLKARKYLDTNPDWVGMTFLINAINKIFLAIGESILILNNSYHYSYQERKKLLLKSKLIPFNDRSIIPLFNQAVDFKLRPNIQEFSNLDLKAKWFYAKNLHERYFRFIEEERLMRQINDWQQYLPILDRYQRPSIIDMFKNLRKNLYRFGFPYLVNYNILFRLFKNPGNLLLSLLPLLLYSFEKKRIREDYISAAARFLDPKFKCNKNIDCSFIIRRFLNTGYF
ncbi:MAG: hypothetical protein ACFFCW_08350 [Candidatus Hodarchaeota archaeon]